MKSAALFSLILISVRTACAAADDSGSADEAVRPKFVVCAAPEDAEFGSSFFRVLRAKGERARFDRAESLEQALASTADVIVLVMPNRNVPKLDAATRESLKQRKIIGIGFGAAQLFGQLGLEINDGACAHGVRGPPSLLINMSELLGEPSGKEPVVVLRDDIEEAPDAKRPDYFAVFLPAKGPNAAVVDVIARWTTDPNYAPIVRQGNCVLIGIPVPATQWTSSYTDLVRRTCLALLERPVQPIASPRRKLTTPGTHEFQLAERGSTDQPFGKTFYFQFSEPVRISAKLEHSGSDAVMLLFMGEGEERLHWQRRDARQQESLEVAAEISREDISKLGDRYWTLNVTNFGANKPAECKLTIRIEKP